MRRQTFWNFLLLSIFLGAVWPTGWWHRPFLPRYATAACARRACGRAGLTLEQLQEMALANNPTLAQAKAGVRAAAGRSRQAGLWPNPTIGYSGDEIRGGSYGGGEQGVSCNRT